MATATTTAAGFAALLTCHFPGLRDLGELADVVVAGPGRPRLDGPGQLQQHLDVALDRFGDLWQLDLDHDFLTAVQPAPVGLADGG